MKNIYLLSFKYFLLTVFIFSTSCAAQNDLNSDEGLIYSLIDHHYKLGKDKNSSEFLYYKTLPVKGNPLFQWNQHLQLSEFLNDATFKKTCIKIPEILDEDQVEELDITFSSLKSVVLDEKRLSRAVLNTRFLEKETYTEVPDAADKRISFPILIKGKNTTYAIFVEDAHNEGGNLFIYEFRRGEWLLICRDPLWLV